MKMTNTKRIDVAVDFSIVPGGRYRSDGPNSGEEFREKFLLPSVKEFEKVIVNLDGTRGYPSSFLDEAFAGLARKMKWNYSQFSGKITILASENYEIYADDIKHYVSKKK